MMYETEPEAVAFTIYDTIRRVVVIVKVYPRPMILESLAIGIFTTVKTIILAVPAVARNDSALNSDIE